MFYYYNMKIALVTLVTKEIEDISYDSSVNKSNYCKKHGIEFIYFEQRLSTRHAQWDKIKTVQKTLPWFDYVIWMDADAVFNNFNTSFKDIINEHPDAPLIICKDPCYDGESVHLMINTGIMIFKNTSVSHKMLHDVWTSVEDYNVLELDKYSYEGYPHEQGALANLLNHKYKNNFVLKEQYCFNTHQNCLTSSTFICHFMGSRETKHHIELYLNKVKEINKNNSVSTKIGFNKLNKTYNNKVSMVTLYTDNIKEYGEFTTNNKRKYCERYKIHLKPFTKRLSERHAAWDKILCVTEVMKNEECEYIIWMDADTMFTNYEIDFRDLINIHNDKNFIVCNDWTSEGAKLNSDTDFSLLENLRIINTGIFIVKNNEQMRNLFEKIWTTKTNTNAGIIDFDKKVSVYEMHNKYDDWPYEQGAITVNFAGRNDYVICTSKSFNCYPTHTDDRTFIVHNMGYFHKGIVLDKFKEQYIYNSMDKKSLFCDKILFTDGTSLVRKGTKWIECTDTCSHSFFQTEVKDNCIFMEDKTRNLWAKIDKQHNFWLSSNKSYWYIIKQETPVRNVKHTITLNDITPEKLILASDIAVVTLGTPNMNNMLIHSRRNHVHYCSKHGYDYIYYNDSLVPREIVTWNKIYVIKKHLRKYKWVIWIDSDAIFTNMNITLESIIEKSENNSLLVCDDIGGWSFNSGVMFWKNNDWSHEQLKHICNMEHLTHARGAEQQQLINLLHGKSGYNIYPRKLFNQHPHEYEDGDFILHMMGKEEHERIEVFRKFNELNANSNAS